MYKLQTACPHDIPVLKELWKLCFDDTDEFIDFFFKKIYPHIYPVVLRTDNDIAGMMYLFSIAAKENKKTKKGFYVYAIGVHPKFRGKDVFKNHMNTPLFNYLRDNNMFCILCPANETLTRFYKKLNYKSVCKLYKTKMQSQGSKKALPCTRIAPKELYVMRSTSFEDSIIWHPQELDLVLKSLEFSDGEALKVNIDNHEYYCIVEKDNNDITLLESNEHSQLLVDFICKRYNVNEIGVLTKNPDSAFVYIEPLSYNLEKADVYFNFAMQ